MADAPDLPLLLRDGRRIRFLAAGGLILVLGIIGAFLPVMPTTIVLIVAAWCFGKSPPKKEEEQCAFKY